MELVARLKITATVKKSTISTAIIQSTTEEETKAHSRISDVEESDDKEHTLVEVLIQLKKEQSSKESTSKEDETDEEMLQEFLENHTGPSECSVSEFDSEANDINLEGIDTDDTAPDVEKDVVSTEDNIASEDYDFRMLWFCGLCTIKED